ncbi:MULTISPECIES: ABC transporter permease [Amycolatopsis]|uniref:ABC transporter permease n=2 Tax=Amycolatopsis TaxID=1813 RepID=A0ABP9QPK3_9PSEU|nr:ABC transporter permease [Amycolatopsis sacchari]SFK08680.1 putative ABC transport system permease protein [Amycolatopsis sacchari]
MSALPAPARLGLSDLVRAGFTGVIGRPARAVLSALGIGIGVAAMVAVLGITTASQARLSAQLASLGTNLLRAAPGDTLFGEAAQLPANAIEMVRRIKPVTAASGTGAVKKRYVYRSDWVDPRDTSGIAVLAAKLDLLPTVSGRLAAGQWLNGASQRYPAVVLGSTAARLLGIDQPGRQVYLGGKWFTVVGVLAPVTLAPELDIGALIGWDAAVSELGFDGRPTTVYERSDDQAVAEVQQVLAASINPEHPEEVAVSRPSDALQAQLAAKTAFLSLFLGLGAVALLVGGVGVANTMVISVLERRSEIGLRRALGASRGQVRTQFLTEAVLLSGLGGLFGVLLGLGVSIGYSVTSGWPVVLPATAIAAGVGASVVIGTVAGWFPAARAARMPPNTVLQAG